MSAKTKAALEIRVSNEADATEAVARPRINTDHICRGKERCVSLGVPERWMANQARVDHTESVPASSVRGRQGSPHLGRMPSPRQCGPMGHPRMTAATPCVLHLFHHQGAERSVTLVPCRVSAIHLEPLGPSRPRRRYCTPDFATAGGSAPYIGVPLFQLGACFQTGRDGTASCP